ncbi:hypothetical protein LZC95_37485 [Pendulispora brunnea]|uniref:Uncharacterized protein n=1 Tax=Pendulispora brunnea TaxID=2905690 RepID=A0ABZ2K229_9BACT
MPASDSVPPADDASTVVTEFPQHLIDALEQSAGLPPRVPGTAPQQAPRAPQPTPAISPMATLEMQAPSLDTVELSGLPPSSKNPTVVRPPFTTLTQHDAPTPAMGSPSYPAGHLEEEPAPVSLEPEDIEDLQVEPYYEAPISVDVAPPSVSPAAGTPVPMPAPTPSPAPAANQGAPNVEPPAPSSFTFAPQRPPGYAPAKPAMAWAEPPPPILMDPPTSAIGWAIGGIVVGLLLLGLVVWLVVLAVRHFT